MPYSVSFEEEQYVLITISSPCSREDHYVSLQKAAELCRRHDCKLLLVDLRNLDTKIFSTMGCFRFGQAVAEHIKYTKLAHVLPFEQDSKDDVKFTSTVEANRGQITGEFESFEKAKEWLLS